MLTPFGDAHPCRTHMRGRGGVPEPGVCGTNWHHAGKNGQCVVGIFSPRRHGVQTESRCRPWPTGLCPRHCLASQERSCKLVDRSEMGQTSPRWAGVWYYVHGHSTQPGTNIDMGFTVWCLVIRGLGPIALGDKYSMHHSCATEVGLLHPAMRNGQSKISSPCRLRDNTTLRQHGLACWNFPMSCSPTRNAEPSVAVASRVPRSGPLELYSVTCWLSDP